MGRASLDVMGLRVERIPTLGDNYTYLIVCEATGEAAVVDAPEAQPVIRRVDEVGCRLTRVLFGGCPGGRRPQRLRHRDPRR